MKENEKYYWLNKDAITFLQRGYLLDGEDPKQRYKNIADTAENTLKIKGFSLQSGLIKIPFVIPNS